MSGVTRTRYPEEDQFCPHMSELMKTFRDNILVHNILRIETEDGKCPILQCKICKVENKCTEIWLQFISEEERKETEACMDKHMIGSKYQ